MTLSLAEFKRRIDAISEAIRSLGGEVQELVIRPPATEQEIERVEHQLGRSLPSSFKQALLHIAGEFSFCWFMPEDHKFPEPYHNIFSGRIHWNLQQLPQIDEGKSECIKQVFPNPEDEYDKVWHDKLAFMEVGNGDYVAFDVKSGDDPPVVYLSHADGQGHGYILAHHFMELLEKGSRIAFVGTEDWQWLTFTESKDSGINVQSTAAAQWRKLIGLNPFPFQNPLAAARRHSLFLRPDGTVFAAGDNRQGECGVDGWQNIVAVAAANVHKANNTGSSHSVGLRSDGTAVAAGWNRQGQCEVGEWRDIIAIAAGWRRTIGLTAQGTVVAAGRNDEGQCEVSDWHDIVAITAGDWHTLGLQSDGTVRRSGNRQYGLDDSDRWRDIVGIAAGYLHSVGVKADGTAVSAGSDRQGQCQVASWQRLSTVSAGSYHTVGLRKDGTVIAAGSNEYGQCNVGDWRNIVAIAAGCTHTLGLQSDGTLLAAGGNESGQCEVCERTD